MAVLFVSCGGGGNNEDSAPVEIPQVKSIEVSPKKITLHKYESAYLTARIYPEGVDHACFWEDQGNLFKEDRGVDSLFILSEYLGEFDVVLHEGRSGLTDTCHVTVTDDPVSVQKITLVKSELEMYEGETHYLSATPYPLFATESIIWGTENLDIAKVGKDNVDVMGGTRGTYISAQKPGITYVTATTKDGFVAKCKVTVKGIEQICLNKYEIELYDGKTETLKVTVLPEGATAKNITWTTENEEIATVFSRGNGNMYEPFEVCITGGRPGVTSVIGTSYDGKVVTKCKVTVKNNNNIEYHPFDDDEQW